MKDPFPRKPPKKIAFFVGPANFAAQKQPDSHTSGVKAIIF
jgi:hypothetical protein